MILCDIVDIMLTLYEFTSYTSYFYWSYIRYFVLFSIMYFFDAVYIRYIYRSFQSLFNILHRINTEGIIEWLKKKKKNKKKKKLTERR